MIFLKYDPVFWVDGCLWKTPVTIVCYGYIMVYGYKMGILTWICNGYRMGIEWVYIYIYMGYFFSPLMLVCITQYPLVI